MSAIWFPHLWIPRKPDVLSMAHLRKLANGHLAKKGDGHLASQICFCNACTSNTTPATIIASLSGGTECTGCHTSGINSSWSVTGTVPRGPWTLTQVPSTPCVFNVTIPFTGITIFTYTGLTCSGAPQSTDTTATLTIEVQFASTAINATVNFDAGSSALMSKDSGFVLSGLGATYDCGAGFTLADTGAGTDCHTVGQVLFGANLVIS